MPRVLYYSFLFFSEIWNSRAGGVSYAVDAFEHVFPERCGLELRTLWCLPWDAELLLAAVDIQHRISCVTHSGPRIVRKNGTSCEMNTWNDLPYTRDTHGQGLESYSRLRDLEKTHNRKNNIIFCCGSNYKPNALILRLNITFIKGNVHRLR